MSRLLNNIESALRSHGWRNIVSAIEENPATKGEVMLWMYGTGYPVRSTRQALSIVQEIDRNMTSGATTR